jgi:toxin ParE1/3/4
VTPRFSLVVRPAARDDIAEAARWYEGRSPGLGARFLAAMDAALGQAREAPERYPQVFRDVRRVLVADFPYAAYYAVRGDVVHVVACMHGRRDPARWRARARGL